ncbi:unnamed protein product, partial [Staurois parvus]
SHLARVHKRLDGSSGLPFINSTRIPCLGVCGTVIWCLLRQVPSVSDRCTGPLCEVPNM